MLPGGKTLTAPSLGAVISTEIGVPPGRLPTVALELFPPTKALPPAGGFLTRIGRYSPSDSWVSSSGTSSEATDLVPMTSEATDLVPMTKEEPITTTAKDKNNRYPTCLGFISPFFQISQTRELLLLVASFNIYLPGL
jgi:hypothetical protein